MGLKVIDNLSNICCGYCFLEEPPFQDNEDLFFLSIVEQRRLGTVMADGTWVHDHITVREFLDTVDRL